MKIGRVIPLKTKEPKVEPSDRRYYLPHRVVWAMYQAAEASPATEEGEAIFGVRLADGSVFVLGTIPDVANGVRTEGGLRVGGDDQVELFRWMKRHWDEMRDKSRGPNQPHWILGQDIPPGVVPVELDLPLELVGEWHKHPGQYKSLSSIDLLQIAAIFKDPASKCTEFFTPLVTCQMDVIKYRWIGDEMVIGSGDEMQIQWYCHTADRPDVIYRVKPIDIPDSETPWLPAYPWHLVEPHRFASEMEMLERNGRKARMMVRQMDDDREHEIVIAVDHPDWTHRVVMVTEYNYPDVAPRVLLFAKVADEPEAPQPALADDAPKEDSKPRWSLTAWLQKKFGSQAEKKPEREAVQPLRRAAWNPRGYYLIDYLRRVQPQIMRPTPPPPPALQLSEVVVAATAPIPGATQGEENHEHDDDDDDKREHNEQGSSGEIVGSEGHRSS